MKEQNAFLMTYVPPISRLEPMEYNHSKLSDATAYSLSKQTVISGTDYIGTTNRDIRIFMQQTQYCIFIRHFGISMMCKH